MSTQNKYQFKGIAGEWVVTNDYGKVICQDDRYHDTITICSLSTKGKLKHRDKHTPHLIAAAPDMHEVCARILTEIENGTDPRDIVEICEDKLRAVIHKALNIQ